MAETSPGDTPGGPVDSLRRRFFSVPTLVSFAVAISLIVLLATQFEFDWRETWENIRGLNPWFYLAAFALHYTGFVFRGYRWRILARGAATADAPSAADTTLRFTQLVLMGWFVNSVAWLRLGDAYRAYAFSQQSKESFSWTLGTILSERVIDMAAVFVLVVIGAVFMSASLVTGGPAYIAVATGLMAAGLALLAAMRQFGPRLARLLPARLEGAYHRFHKGALGSLRQLPVVLALSFTIWLIEAGRLYLVVQALDANIGLALVLVATVIHAVLSTVPTPGGVGAVELGLTSLLVVAGMEYSDAGSVVVLERSITYLSVILVGGVMFLLWQVAIARRRGEGAAAGAPLSEDLPALDTKC